MLLLLARVFLLFYQVFLLKFSTFPPHAMLFLHSCIATRVSAKKSGHYISCISLLYLTSSHKSCQPPKHLRLIADFTFQTCTHSAYRNTNVIIISTHARWQWHMYTIHILILTVSLQCESKNPPPPDYKFFIKLSATLTKLCHIKHDHHNVLKMSTIDRNVRWMVALNMA